MRKFKYLMLAVCYMFMITVALSPYFTKHAQAEAQKKIYLTFDDGPTAITERILDVLSENEIKATFFVIGKNVERHPDTLRRIFKEGHAVGIHSYTHDYKEIYKDEQSLIADIKLCSSAIKAVNSKFTPTIYRFPGGSFNLKDTTKNVPSKLGLKYYDWNASCRDCEITTDDYRDLINCATNTSAGKDTVIMLLHDAADKKLTASALPSIIKAFKNKNFLFDVLKNQ